MEGIIITAVLLDLIMGDPRKIPHPVVYIGKVITALEAWLRKHSLTPRGLRIGGVFLTTAVVAGTYLFFTVLLWGAYQIHLYLGVFISVFFLSQALAINSLCRHALSVIRPLQAGCLAKARQALSMIVGRDTENMDERDIIRGTVETVAENTVDGITAPLFYAFVGGPPLALAYKAVNTLDSMVGYRDERFRDLGWASARLDDAANYIPARITALIYLLISPFTPGGFQGVWTTIRRDAPKHLSPNSGIPEAAVAGALKIQLGGLNYYKGVPSYRAKMGGNQNPLEVQHVYHAIYIMLAVTGFMLWTGILIFLVIKAGGGVF